MVSYGLKEILTQDKFSTDDRTGISEPLVITPRKLYYFERGDGSESADARLVKCVKDETGWTCSSELSESAGWWISVSHILTRNKRYTLGAWAVVPNPKLWVVNDTIQTYTYGSSNQINLGLLAYLVEHDKFLTGGECSGNKLRLLDPNNNWTEEASWTFSWLSDKSYGKIDAVPRNDDKLYILAGIGTASASPHNAILGIVDIDDLLANPNTNIDELGSWQQIKDFGEYPTCVLVKGYHARFIVVGLSTSGDEIYDPVNDTVIAIGRPHLVFGDGCYGIYDLDNGIFTLYDKTGSQIGQITGLAYDGYSEIFDIQLFTVMRSNNKTTLHPTGLTMDGYTPIPEFDLENNRFRIIDFHTEQEIAFKVMIVWSKAGNGLASPIIVDETKKQILDVSTWTNIPSAPAIGKWLMTVVPLEPL